MATLEQLRTLFPDAASDEDVIVKASERFKIDAKSIADEVGYDGGASSKNRERMSASVDNYQANLYGLVGAGSRALGAPGLSKWADRQRSDNEFQAQIASGRARDQGAIESYKDVGSVGDAADYVVGLGIQSLPYMGEALAGGMAGRAILGGATAASRAAASIGGATAASYPSSVGDILQNQRDQAGEENLGTAAAGGVPYALLNAGLGVEGALARGGLVRNTVKSLDNMGGARGVLARTGASAGKTALQEGVSETGQEVINQVAGRMAVDPNETFLNERSADRFGESFVGGAALGGVFGGAGGGWRRSQGYKAPVDDTPGSTTDILDQGPPLALEHNGYFKQGEGQNPFVVFPDGSTATQPDVELMQRYGMTPDTLGGLRQGGMRVDPDMDTGNTAPYLPGKMVADQAGAVALDAPGADALYGQEQGDPGLAEARRRFMEQQARSQAEEAKARETRKAAIAQAAQEFAGRKAKAYEELIENGPDGKPMAELKPNDVLLHHNMNELLANGKLNEERYLGFAGALKEAFKSGDKKSVNAVRKEVDAIMNPKPVAPAKEAKRAPQPNVPVPAAVAPAAPVGGSAKPAGSGGNMGRVADDATQRAPGAAAASAPSVPAPAPVGGGTVQQAAAVAAPAPAAPAPVVTKKTKKLQPLPPAPPAPAPVAPPAPKPLIGPVVFRKAPKPGEKVAAAPAAPRAPAPKVVKYDNMPDLIDAVAKENGLPQAVADAYLEHKVMGRSLDKIASDLGVGKSTVGDWVKKLGPLVSNAEVTRLEAGAKGPAVETAPEADVAPGAEAAEIGEDVDKGDGPVEADNVVMADEATVDEDGNAVEGDTDPNINIEDTGYGKGKTRADNNIAPERAKKLAAEWNKLSDTLPEGQRVAWKDLGSAQQDAFDAEQAKGRASQAHVQLTDLVNQGVKYATADGAPVYTHVVVDPRNGDKVMGRYQSAAAARKGRDRLDNIYGAYRYKVREIGSQQEKLVTVDGQNATVLGRLVHDEADGSFAGLKNLPAADDFMGIGAEEMPAQVNALTPLPNDRRRQYGPILYYPTNNRVGALISAGYATVRASSLGRLFGLAEPLVTKVGQFLPSSDKQKNVGGAYLHDQQTIVFNEVLLRQIDTGKPSLAVAQMVLHEHMHALDMAAGRALTGAVLDATTLPDSPTLAYLRYNQSGTVEVKANPVAREALRAFAADPVTMAPLTQSMSRVLDQADLLQENGGQFYDAEHEANMRKALDVASTELMPKLMELYATAPEMLKKRLPLGYAYAERLAGATTIEQVAATLGGKNAQDVQAGGTSAAGQPVLGEVRQVSAGEPAGDGGRERGQAGAVADGRQAAPGAAAGGAGDSVRLIEVPPPILDGGKGVVQWLKNLTSDKLWRTVPSTLGFLSTEQLADRFSDIPMVKAFSDVMRAMGGLANKIMVESDRINGEWRALAKRHGEATDNRFSQMLLDATTINAWPDEDLGVGKNKHLDPKDGDLAVAHLKLQQTWRTMPVAYRNLFSKIAADKAEHRDQKVALLRTGIVESYYPRIGDVSALPKDVIDQAAGIKKIERDAFLTQHSSSALAKDTLTKLWRDIDAHAADFKFLPGPYFPKMRFGDHIVSYKSNGYRAGEEALARAKAELQAMLAADTYAPIAQVEQEIKSINGRMKRSTVQETRAALKTELAAARAELEILMRPVEAARKLVSERQAQLTEMKANGQHYGVEFYETRAQAQVNEQRLRAHFDGKGYTVQRDLKNQFLRSMDGVTPEFMRRIEEKMATALPGADAQKVRDSMRELYLRLQPDNSALKSQLKRLNVTGVRPEEAHRAYATSSMRDAHSISRLRYGHELHEHLNELRFTRTDEDAKLVGNELALRVAQNMQANDHGVLQAVTNLTYLSYLGLSPSFMVMQITQPWIVSGPVMAARHGIRETGKLLSQASVDAAKLLKGSYDQDKRWKFLLDPTVGVADGTLTPDEAKMLTEMLDNGRIDITITRDLGASSAGRDDTKLGIAAQVASYPAQQLEVVNRIATALAGYRAEKAKSGDHMQSMQYADTLVADTHLNYAAENRARLMHPDSWGGWGRVMFQFRTYQQGMLYLIYKNLVDGFGTKKDPEARKAVAYLAGMQLATAGLAGMPVPGVLAATIGLLYKGFEDDDDEVDLKEALFQGIKSVVGETGAIAATKGIPAALGVDISGRVGMGSIASVAPYADDRKEGRDWVTAYFAASVGGPTLGMAMNWAEAVKAAGQGDFIKAAAMASPKVLADPIRAAGYATKGMTDSRQNQILAAEEMSAADVLIKATGFQPTTLARVGDQRRAFFEARQNRDDARQSILGKFVRARTQGGDVSEVWAEVYGYNSRHPEDRITPAALEKAVAQRRMNERNLRNGVPVSRRDRALAAGLGVE